MTDYLQSDFSFSSLPTYFDEMPLWSAPFGIKLLEKVQYKTGITVLDIGTGTGFPALELAMRMGKSSVVYALDPCVEAMQRARQKAEYYAISNLVLLHGVAESIPLETASVDLLVSNNGLNNVNNISRSLTECSRVCRSGAQFVQSYNLEGSMIEFYEILGQVLEEYGQPEAVDAMRKHIYQKRKPVQEVVALMEEHGFENQEIEYHGFSYTFSNGTAMLEHYFFRLAFIPSWKELIKEDLHEQVFSEVELRMNTIAAAAGGWKVSIPFVVLNARKK